MSDKKPLSEFYEKLYFHEIDAREKLYSRLNVPLALFGSLGAGLLYMLQNLQRDQPLNYSVILFYIAFSLACLFLLVAGYYLKSAASGQNYQFIAAPAKWVEYKQSCDSLYAEYDDSAALSELAIRQRISDEYIRCATVNAEVNDSRANCLFLTIKFLIVAATVALLAFLIFHFSGFDKAIKPKPLNVNIVKPVELKGSLMTAEKIAPPPPPPPPPARTVREDVRPTTPTQKPEQNKHGQ